MTNPPGANGPTTFTSAAQRVIPTAVQDQVEVVFKGDWYLVIERLRRRLNLQSREEVVLAALQLLAEAEGRKVQLVGDDGVTESIDLPWAP